MQEQTTSGLKRLSLAWAPLCCWALIFILSSAALADNVPVGVYPYDSGFADINAPVVGVAGFNGINFFTPVERPGLRARFGVQGCSRRLDTLEEMH